MPLRVEVLGPLRVLRDGTEVSLGGQKQRAVLGILGLEAGRVISVDRLAEQIWPDPPASATATLQVYVSNLRRLLGKGDKAALVWRPPGYMLQLAPEQVDLLEFRRQVAIARELATTPAAAAAWNTALGLWRGPALEDLGDIAQAARTQLDMERASAEREHMRLRLELRELDGVPARLETMLTEAPLDEDLWGMLMLALYRAGRQADALAAFARARSALDEELGLEPSAALRELESRILAQDPLLHGQPHPLGTAGPDTTVRRTNVATAHAWLWLSDGRKIPIHDGELVVGRSPECELTLSDRLVSRRHLAIRCSHGQVLVEDLGSTNGTSIDEEELKPHRPRTLALESWLGAGSTRMQLRATPS